jgi:hypothetical protein
MTASTRARKLELARKFENSNKELQSSAEQKIKERNNWMREEVLRENDKLVEQFQLENEKPSQEFSGRLQAGTSKLSRQVSNYRVIPRRN